MLFLFIINFRPNTKSYQHTHIVNLFTLCHIILLYYIVLLYQNIIMYYILCIILYVYVQFLCKSILFLRNKIRFLR